MLWRRCRFILSYFVPLHLISPLLTFLSLSTAVPPTLSRKASPKTSKKTLVTSQQTKKPTPKNPVNPTPNPVPAPDLGPDSELAATVHVVDACDEDERKPASEGKSFMIELSVRATLLNFVMIVIVTMTHHCSVLKIVIAIIADIFL